MHIFMHYLSILIKFTFPTSQMLRLRNRHKERWRFCLVIKVLLSCSHQRSYSKSSEVRR